MKKFVPRIHYRLVTDTAGYPLSSFKGSRELLEATYDAFIGKARLQFTCILRSFTAVMDAHEKAETLHRNVSLPNIILYRPERGARRAGYLIDWELCVVPRNRAPYDHVLAVCPIVLCPK